MASTFMGLEIGRRGLVAHQQAMTVTGHNISNADNENYSRQRVGMTSMAPLYDPSLNRAQGPGMIGQGVTVDSIERVRDSFIDDRLHDASQNEAYWSTRQKFLTQMEMVYNEPSDQSLRSQLDKFWQSWQELSQFPEEYSHREQVISQGQELSMRLRDTYNRLSQLRNQADQELEASVNRLNLLGKEVAELNNRIFRSQSVGDRPNDLLDRRDQLVKEMTGLADIHVERQDENEVMIYLGSEVLVQGKLHHNLKIEGDTVNEGLKKIQWENGKDAIFRSGKIQGLLEMRDGDLKENIEKMDLLTVNLADIVNEVHRDGFGLNKETNHDFFKLDNLARNSRGNFDLNNDGADDISAVFKIAGRNALEADRPIGIGGVLTFVKNDAAHTPVNIQYRPDDTVKAVVDRINQSEAGVVAYLNHNNNLVLKGTLAEDNWKSNFIIRHAEDSGEFLTGFAGILQNSGQAGSFDYRRLDEVNRLQPDKERITLAPALHPAGAIEVNAGIVINPALVATASGKDSTGMGDPNQPNGAKDGSNAMRIAQAMRHNENMVGDQSNVQSFYSALISKLGTESQRANEQVENHELIIKNLNGMRQSVMGVNLDEEMANMVQFQHGYNAAARVINIMDEMLARIIEKLGS